eukprot:gene4563-5160_t
MQGNNNMMLTAFLLIHGIILQQSDCLVENNGKIFYEDKDGSDILIGGYFAVHKKGPTASECGKIDPESGVYLLEAMRYAIRRVNNRGSLSGVKLGIRIVDTCSGTITLRDDLRNTILHPVVGVVGPSTSDEAILASSALGVFQIPLISYSASSVDLNDRVKYHNFFRTIPADDVQDAVFVDVLKHFNWTYLSTVNSHGIYGQRGMDGLIARLAPNGVCIATRNVLPQSPNESDYQRVVKNLNADSKAKVVVLFTTAKDTYELMQAAKSSHTKFVWLSSSAWSADMEAVRGINDVAKGALLLNYFGINNLDFRQHFLGLKLSTNKYRWFEEFWENAFNCSIQQNSTRACSGNESLTESNFYGKYAASMAVIDAVNAYACNIERTILRFCGGLQGINRTVCAKKLSIHTLRNYARYLLYYKSNCKDFYYGERKFDSMGNFYRDIVVVNFDGKGYNTVGVWKLNTTATTKNIQGHLTINQSMITWQDGKDGGEEKYAPQSVCSLPCQPGAITIKSGTKICCFTCKWCGDNGYVKNNTCKQCGQLERPNNQRTFCRKLPLLQQDFKDLGLKITLIVAFLGTILTTVVVVLFVKHRNSKIVKSSSRELSSFILFGLYLCFTSTFVFFIQPSIVLCGLRRFIFGMSLTVCYTALMLKTNRIYRIFKAATVMVSVPQFVSPRSQVILCSTLLGIQLLLCILWVVGIPPTVVNVIYENHVAAVCMSDITTVIINILPCFSMMFISTIFAFKTRKFPKNFNEASSIGTTMYISCFLWAIFIPLLLFVKIESQYPFGQTYVITSFSNLIGLVSLFGLFGPKVRRILLLKEKESAQVYFSSFHKDHSISNTVDIIFNNSLNNSLDINLNQNADADTGEENTRKMKKSRSKTF